MQGPPVRRPAVAGHFYPDEPSILTRDLDQYLSPQGESAEPEEARRPIACLVPHAGYQYSGHVAGAVYSRLPSFPLYIILGPNHFGRGAPLAMTSEGAWRTPLGDVPLDKSLGYAARQACHLLVEDPDAHHSEHSLEVQVPFLQRRGGRFSMLAIAVGPVGYAALELLGRGVANAVRQAGKPVLIVASSDMNHYEPDSITRQKDGKAIEKVLALDPQGLYEVIRSEDISMCGYGPAIAMLTAAKELGSSRASLVKYATSGDINRDRSAVVGYAGIVVYAGSEEEPGRRQSSAGRGPAED